MAETYNRTVGGAYSAAAGGIVRYIYNEVDLAKAGAAAAAAPVATDVVKVLRIPKGAQLLTFGCYVTDESAGTDLVLTFGATASKGLTVAGTAVLINSATPLGLGILAAATITGPKATAKATDDAAEDVFLTVTMTTVSSVSDMGKQMYYATYAEPNPNL